MNPEKIQKMDEEVKKWSRKDPQAIKKAMVYPRKWKVMFKSFIINFIIFQTPLRPWKEEEWLRTTMPTPQILTVKTKKIQGHQRQSPRR